MSLRHAAKLPVYAVAGTLLLSGCMVGPKYSRPSAPAAASYKEVAPDMFRDTPDWSVAKPEDAIPRGTWWTLFHDDTLNTLEPQVEAANQTLKAADANLAAARAEIRVRNASRYPTLSIAPFAGGVRDSDVEPYFTAPADNVGSPEFLLPLQVSYEVDLWGRIRRNIAAAREEAQATAADRTNALLSLQAELAMDYFELRCDDALQKLLNDTVVQYREALRVTTNRFEGGIAPKSDVTQAQTQLQSAIVEAADVAVQRAQYEHAIAALLGKAPSELSVPVNPLPLDTLPPIVPPGLPAHLLERRPDIAAGERRIAEANEQIGIARAAFFPTLSLSGQGGFESTTVTNLVTQGAVVYGVGPTLSQTFFDAGRRRGISAEAQANYDAVTANYRQSVLTAYQQVEDNLVALRVLQKEAVQQRAGTVAAQESERIFNNRYVGGVDTYLQVITAQTAALNNERNDIDILRGRMDASVLLIKVLGGGWTTAQLPPQ